MATKKKNNSRDSGSGRPNTGSSSSGSGGSSPSGSGSMGSYKGVNIPSGSSQAQITKIIRDTDAKTSSGSSSSPTVNSAPTGTMASNTGGVYAPPGKGNVFGDGNGGTSTKETWGGASTVAMSSGGRNTWGGVGATNYNTPAPAPIPQNPESVMNSKERYNNFRMSIDEVMNDPWLTRQEKKDKKQAITTSFAGEFGKGFNSAEEFAQALQDQSFANMIKDYEKQGGDVAAITASIGKPAVGQQQPQGYQTIDQYLGALTTPSEQRAFESLIPEQKIAQDQIAFEQSIPDQYKDYYFGTPDQIGFLEQQKKQKQEEIKLLERKAKLDEKNARAQVDYAIDKARAEVDIAETEVEQNRLQAKNYMTGMLAKLGALNTSSGAPIVIAELEQDYQQQKQQLRSDFNYQQRELEMKLTEEVDNIGLERDENILKIKSDISKSEEDAWKEIFKLQNEADKNTFKILGSYASDFRMQTDKYTKEAKAAAEKWAKANSKAISTYDLDGVMEGGYAVKRDAKGKKVDGGILMPGGDIESISNILERNRGADTFVNPKVYDQMWKEYQKSGGTIQEFKKEFPPVDYIKPNESYPLPTALRYEKPSQTESKTKGREI